MYCETEMEVSKKLDHRYYISRNISCIKEEKDKDKIDFLDFSRIIHTEKKEKGHS